MKADTPTARQLEVLRFIRSCVAARGYPPTNREMREEFDLHSSNSVAQHLRALERKGLITRLRYQARAVSLTDSGFRWAVERRAS